MKLLSKLNDMKYTQEELFKVGARYAVFGQSFLEVLDEMKETPMYSNKTKQLINKLTKELEKNTHISGIFLEGQDVVTDISDKLDKFIDSDIEEIIERIKKC